MLFGGDSSTTSIDSGLQWNAVSETMEAVFAESSNHPLAGYGMQFPCVGSLEPDEYLLVTTGPLNVPIKGAITRLSPQEYLMVEEYYADGTDSGIGEVNGPFTLSSG